jgi:hypothetical protein
MSEYLTGHSNEQAALLRGLVFALPIALTVWAALAALVVFVVARLT